MRVGSCKEGKKEVEEEDFRAKEYKRRNKEEEFKKK